MLCVSVHEDTVRALARGFLYVQTHMLYPIHHKMFEV